MISKFIIMVAALMAEPFQGAPESPARIEVAAQTGAIQKTTDSQDVDVIWLAACMTGLCNGSKN